MDEIIESMANSMSLTEGEKKGITITEVDTANLREKNGCCLLGKLMLERRIQNEAFKSLMTTLWKTLADLAFKELYDNLWLLEFSNKADKRCIMEDRPWLFDRSILVLLKELDVNIPHMQMDFSKDLFWVQVHYMPLICMNQEVGLQIGQSLGTVEDIDVTGDGVGWGRCLRLRVYIDISMPLKRGRALVLNPLDMKNCHGFAIIVEECFANKACIGRTSFRLNNNASSRSWGAWIQAEDLRGKKEGQLKG